MIPAELDVEAMAIGMVRSIENNDLEAVAALNAPGMKVWHNIDDTDMSWDEAAPFLQLMIDSVSSLHYEDIRITKTPEGWLQQHVLRMVLKDGGECKMPAALSVMLNADGKVRRIEEYLDSRHLAIAMPFLASAT